MVKKLKTLNMNKKVSSPAPAPRPNPKPEPVPDYPMCKKCGLAIISPNKPVAHHGQIYHGKCV